MASGQFTFFGTREDLLPIGVDIERSFPVKYVAMGLFDASDVEEFATLESIPGLERTDSLSSPTLDHHYMICPNDSSVAVRTVPQRAGGTKYAIDMLRNRSSVELSAGGLANDEKIILPGRFATFAEDDFSRNVYKTAQRSVRRTFRYTNGVWLGPDAERLHRDGFRLTRAARLPIEQDLVVTL